MLLCKNGQLKRSRSNGSGITYVRQSCKFAAAVGKDTWIQYSKVKVTMCRGMRAGRGPGEREGRVMTEFQLPENNGSVLQLCMELPGKKESRGGG